MRTVKIQHRCDSAGCKRSVTIRKTSPMTLPKGWCIGRLDYCPDHADELKTVDCPGCGHKIQARVNGLPWEHLKTGAKYGGNRNPRLDAPARCHWPIAYSFRRWGRYEDVPTGRYSYEVWCLAAKILSRDPGPPPECTT